MNDLADFPDGFLQTDCKIRLSFVFCSCGERPEAAVETLKKCIEQQEMVK